MMAIIMVTDIILTITIIHPAIMDIAAIIIPVPGITVTGTTQAEDMMQGAIEVMTGDTVLRKEA